ncbi:hypothetical protein NOS3756_57600 (plasmid) [Nostoc sp. NIES-3756]|uniref:hypothetical protein n=1 Tax=Nostoc sp. NIES-3756 TaxID=1751286 RepID=UPI00071F03CC|nr:hypothetical protein [Nostoc sp. NIES-3756]BAT56748.1 hypothetical protein NOS3756_57600 [Nostoc sp. NIES-3756]
MKKLLIFSAIAFMLCQPVAAVATPVVRSLHQSLASGTGAKPQTINVWNGHGVSISFYGVGEAIQRVWIDDPSQILIDTDGCLKGIDSECEQPGAGLLHLRRIKKLSIRGLPQVRATHLTIITQTITGERKSYHFVVAPSNGKPQYSQIAITGDESPPLATPPPRTLQPITQTMNTSRQIRFGVAVAIRNKLLQPSSALHGRIEQLITYLVQGDELSTAANKAVVSMELVNKLIQLGQSPSLNI